MKSIITIILGIAITGIGILLCLCFCIMATFSDDFWDDVKRELEKNNDRK